MTHGIDIYARYQNLTDPGALQRSHYDFAYVKGTDGAGPAMVRADGLVRQLMSVGIPVGLYHYAQFAPSPEQQAAVLAAEVRRLGATGLPPALDLEDPFPMSYDRSRDFAQRFLVALNRLGFPRVTLYANTSMMNAIRAWELDGVLKPLGGDVLIWAADYGGNDADYDQEDQARLARRYPHPVWMHQYSSTGPVPGIPGNVDKNWMFHPIEGEDDMPLTEDDLNRIANKVRDGILINVFAQDGSYAKNPDGSLYVVSLGEILGRNNQAGWGAVIKGGQNQEMLAALQGQIAGLAEAIGQLAGDQDVDLAAIEAAAERGAQRGVEQATVNVDIDIAGRPPVSDTPETNTPTG